MELRRSLTGGLAWAGLVIVVAVPTVEAVRSKLVHDGAGAMQTVAEIEAPGVSPPAVVPTVVAPVASPIIAKKPTIIAPKPPAADVAAAQPIVAPIVHISPRPTTGSPVAAEAPVASVAAQTAPEVPKAVPSKPAALPVTTAAAAAPVATTPTQVGSDKDTVVDQYLATGKALPSYIKASPSPASAASTSASTGTAPRPEPGSLTPNEMGKLDDAGGVIQSTDATPVEATTAEVPPPLPMPVAARPKAPPQRLVTEADLKGWRSGSLADYLRQRGLLSDDEAGGSN